jgi:hypothetical protein
MADTLLSLLRGKAAEWRTRAAQQRHPSIHNPIADTLDVCAEELERALEDEQYVSVEDYARIHPERPHVQTVRKWCRLGWLAAIPTRKGYLIHRDAVVRPVRRTG